MSRIGFRQYLMAIKPLVSLKTKNLQYVKETALITTRKREFKSEKRKINLELFALKQTGDLDIILSIFQELVNESGIAQEGLILIFLMHQSLSEH
ncbi:hypothetical protein BpHYR1_030127 [Brachionus plicatilis]|uniref:Uncharacterized protein n=1 Tax=Brachionus plicatilis TaxID=10195 RepID=A0A3M7RM27_BRAPC|nr:hypothetical protein BpHYR1_030127 [Brachionus plicatilis]